MSSISFIAPNCLSKKEFSALRKNKFELHCLNMSLVSLSSNGKIYTGPGSIQQTIDGKLRFIIYSNEKVPIDEILQELGGEKRIPAGAILPEEKFFRLSAKDSKGRKWVCEKLLISYDTSIEGGTIFTGFLPEIVYRKPKTNIQKELIYLEFFDKQISLPYNAVTEVNRNIAGKTSQSSSLNVLKFTTDDMEFLAQKDENFLILSSTNKVKFLKDFEVKIIESLQFVLARPLWWSLLIKESEGSVSTIIRNSQNNDFQYRIQPPINLNSNNADAFCQIFSCYLKFTSNYSQNILHPVSAQMRSICQASVGTIETKALVLSVAVESIVKHIHTSKYQLTSTEKKWLKKARKFFDSWEGPENLSKRIIGLFSILSNISASTQLMELVELSAITEDQIKAWKRIRHKVAHGEGLGSSSLQEFSELSNTVLVLFYHMIFFAIGYQGKYTDYSTLGWPTKEYK